jgi:hypothetical protein
MAKDLPPSVCERLLELAIELEKRAETLEHKQLPAGGGDATEDWQI